MRAFAAAIALLLAPAGALQADDPTPYPGTVVIETPHAYAALIERLEAAVARNGMAVVARASATLGARSLGVTVPGNMVVMVYHPRFAVRMLEAYVPAGFEAPIRYYVTENADGSATLTYRTPSSLFAPYDNDAIDAMAAELDAVFASIARDAAGR